MSKRKKDITKNINSYKLTLKDVNEVEEPNYEITHRMIGYIKD